MCGTWASVGVAHLGVLVLAGCDAALEALRVLGAALFVAVAVGLDIACEPYAWGRVQTPEGEAKAWLRTRAAGREFGGDAQQFGHLV